MAKAPETEDSPKKKRRGTSVMVWVLMAMLVGGLGGFGVTNFGGGVSKIGSVGDREITTSDYARDLQSQLNAMSQQFGTQITLAQAQSLGLDRQVLQGLVTRAALDNEAERIGLSAGDAEVAARLSSMQSFQGTAGTFDRATYRSTLRQNNTNEAEFEAGLRADIAGSLLQGSVTGGFVAPASMTGTLFDWAGERRGFTLLRLSETNLATPVPAPTEEELKAYYDAHVADYTRPEARRIAYAALLPDTLAPTMTIPDEDVKKAYDARLSEFVVPEKRLVERLVFGTEEEAAKAKARLDVGETFEALVAERKLSLEDIDMGDVSKADLGAAGDAVFALTGPGVVGPLPSDLGPALFRMNAILAAQETTLDQARPDLLKLLQTDAARKAISGKVEAVDDLLAGGASLEELAKEEGMTFATTDYAPGADDNDPIAAYKGFRDAVAKLGEGDFPEAVMLDDGGLVATQLLETVPPTPRPYESVKDKVTEAWHAQALAKALADEAVALKAKVEAGSSLGALGIAEHTASLDRQGSLAGAPPSVLEAVFRMSPGDVQVVEADGFTALVQLDDIQPAKAEGEDATALRDSIVTQSQRAISGDVFTLYTNALTSEAGIQLDQAAINAVHAQFGN